MRRVRGLFLALAWFSFCAAANGAIVIGGSLLTAEDAGQIESWLDEGPLQFTSLFEKGAGSTSEDFHAAADGAGRTVVLVEVVGGSNGDGGQVVGGYNPQSWASEGAYHHTPNLADRTAFLFNLTTGEKQDQAGACQTFNWGEWGPIFGGGYDLFIGADLNSGYAQAGSFGSGSDNILAGMAGYTLVQVGRIEVFSIVSALPLNAAHLPEPASVVIWSAMGAAAIVFRRRRKTGERF